ncbi:MAG TPA: cell division protein FtsZ, partial [Sphingomicrobium sp.]|nr:cell division protein FtsZ [Sphingomicrobium sp.]
DANIIWGSAFNNDLDGKIRVSVVATGIEAEAVTQPQPGKVFAFPRTTAATTVTSMTAAPAAPAPAPVMEETAEEEDETLELADDGEGDELLLDSDDVLTSPVGSAPIAPPPDEDEVAETASAESKPKVRETGTLFERMSNIARGAAQAQVDEEDAVPSYRREPIDIPRFLNRQNNQ